ncbi:hypothetical protein [Stutzerimonas xanthomarina]|uniref:hypothetical protein n=1 Tax=Stutzerimonas xanthomarina TaxID=271420 RepID=UPI003AA7FE16
MSNIKTADSIFLPNGQPTYSYVSRHIINEYGHKESREDLLEQALKEDGTVISIAGPSKSGKTALIHRVAAKLRKPVIKISGIEIDNSDSFWVAVSKKAGMPLEQKSGKSNSFTEGTKASTELKAGSPVLLQAAAKLEGEEKNETKQESQYTNGKWSSEEVAKFINSRNGLLLIDDFHYASEELQNRIAKTVKHAAESYGLKVCVAQILHKNDAPIRANPDLDGRIFRLDFQYWPTADLMQIGDAFSELNARVDKDIIEFMATEAAGSPQLMQRFCKNLCDHYEIKDNNHPHIHVHISSLQELDRIFISGMKHVNKSSLLKAIEEGMDSRGKARNLYIHSEEVKLDVYECCIAAVTYDPPQMALTIDEINDRVIKLIQGDKPGKQSLSSTLQRMSVIAKEISRKANQGLDFIDIDEDSNFNFIDPYFFYYARWSSKYYKIRR